MSAQSHYLAEARLNQILNGIGGATAFTGAVYISLFLSDPGPDDSGTEVSGNNYARVLVDASGANPDQWLVSTPEIGAPGTVGTNIFDIVFPVASGGDWGTITHWGIHDAASGGNLLYGFGLIQALTINNGDARRFPAGALSIREE